MPDPHAASTPPAHSHATPRPRDAAELPAWRRQRLAEARLYVCIDARRELDDDARAAGFSGEFPALRRDARAALSGGVDVIQLRDKNSPGAARFGALEAGAELAALAVMAEECAAAGALLAVNDRADIAATAGADVCHVGQGDLPVDAVRRIVGDEVIIGLSCHAAAEVDAAIAAVAVDYFCTGPVWPTPTKPGREAPGLPLVAHAAAVAGGGKPWFAIGGIDGDNLGAVRGAGARRIVVVRAVTAAADIAAAAAALRAQLPDPQ